MAAERSRTTVHGARRRALALLERLPVRRAGESTAPGHPGCCLHRASVVDDEDPAGQRRLQVVVPGLLREPVWALPCTPPGVDASPAVGDVVWVTFEQGDLDSPVWLGVLPGRRPDPDA